MGFNFVDMTNKLSLLGFVGASLISMISLAGEINSDRELDQFEYEISNASGLPPDWKFPSIEDLSCNLHPDSTKIANEISDQAGSEIFWQMLLIYPKAQESIRLRGKDLLKEYWEVAQRSQGKCGLRLIETAAIQFYGSDAFTLINSYLRNSSQQGHTTYDRFIRLVLSGLEKIADFSGAVYRGYHLPSEILKEVLGSRIYSDGAFISTSRFIGPASRYSKGGLMKLHVRSCKYIAPLMVYAHEEEVLCLPKAQFHVKKYRKFRDKLNLILEDVSQK